ncbi:hypothetical protein MTLP_00960 [Candidatus Methanoliparum sp. LAM-1]|nr:hypothetical protein MTLP_00960 [Candidatus Methanoliparum sp. LAM-1]
MAKKIYIKQFLHFIQLESDQDEDYKTGDRL